MVENKIKIQKIDFYSLGLILIIFSLDRLSKLYVINLIKDRDSEIFLYDFLNITLNWNTGIAFGLLSSNTNFFYHFVSAIILLIIIYLIYLMVKEDNYGKIIFALIIGGAVGNLYDRLTYFDFPDFIDFHIKNFHWFTFNIADVFITFGIFFMLIKEFFFKQNS